MNPITEERLKELVTLAEIALSPMPMVTNPYNAKLKRSSIWAREKYRRLSFELAGELARLVLALRVRAGVKESVSAETAKE